MRDIVNALLMRKGTILMARRSLQREAYPGTWSFPGGHVEKDETLEAALIREVREEIGVAPTVYRFLRSIADPNAAADDPVTYHMFAVTAWQGGEPAIRDDEHAELGWFGATDAISLSDLALGEYRSLMRGLMGRDLDR